ncbi:MAG: hypothetical protein BTN85_0769 [Candidatus Methanohalarchaeum thermophilum]|uniref:Uncharacterized protein n=1 Tax=Methanohalarchaeum thermophilum TaxID=1903181 RepID=A0A1Q6DVE5_METT1|nr:MAG: hypothetical protein BTN85_0769 [Candidatus Methanohalarchaeum thermophilum]
MTGCIVEETLKESEDPKKAIKTLIEEEKCPLLAMEAQEWEK